MPRTGEWGKKDAAYAVLSPASEKPNPPQSNTYEWPVAPNDWLEIAPTSNKLANTVTSTILLNDFMSVIQNRSRELDIFVNYVNFS